MTADHQSRLQLTVDADTVSVVGEIDARTSLDLIEVVDKLLADGATTLDLAGVTFMDSSGLRVLVDAQRTSLQSGNRFVVNRPSSRVRKILQISGLLDAIEITEHPARAVEAPA